MHGKVQVPSAAYSGPQYQSQRGTFTDFKSVHAVSVRLLLFLYIKALLQNSAILRSPTI